MSDLLEQLRASLSATYDFERELGGGGMARVFVATETSLAAVIKGYGLDPAVFRAGTP